MRPIIAVRGTWRLSDSSSTSKRKSRDISSCARKLLTSSAVSGGPSSRGKSMRSKRLSCTRRPAPKSRARSAASSPSSMLPPSDKQSSGNYCEFMTHRTGCYTRRRLLAVGKPRRPPCRAPVMDVRNHKNLLGLTSFPRSMLTTVDAGILMELKIVGHTQKSRIGPGADAALFQRLLKLITSRP